VDHCSLTLASKTSSILLKKLQLWKAGVVLSYASNIQKKLSVVFLFKSAICQVTLCLFMIVCPIAIAISMAHSFSQFSLICDTVSLLNYIIKLMIVLISEHFSTCAKFGKILRKYRNSMKKGKFCSLAWNSAACEKWWALFRSDIIQLKIINIKNNNIKIKKPQLTQCVTGPHKWTCQVVCEWLQRWWWWTKVL